MKFGAYRRDADTGLDYAEQRYYSSALGRFLRPDPYGGSSDVGVPQSWNRYGYVLSDPANGNDPSGLDGMFCLMPDGEGGQQACSAVFSIGVTAPVFKIDVTPQPEPDPSFQAKNAGAGAPNTDPRAPGPGQEPSGNGGGATNNATPKPTIPHRVKQFVCKGSPARRIFASVRQGAIVGAIRGGASGFVGGEIGEPLGGGIPGAILGGFLGGTVGAAGGVFSGSAIAIGCSLMGAY